MRLIQTGGLLLAFVVLATPLRTQTADAPLSITPGKIAFGEQSLNAASQPLSITLANRSSTNIALAEIISSGIDFSSKSDCARQLAPGTQCTIQIVFKPVIAGDRMGVVEILANDSSNPHFVPLSGTGK